MKRDRSGAGRAWAIGVTIALGLTLAGAPAVAQTPAGFNSTRPAERIEYWQKRLGEISTPRGTIRTPAFMPVGTAATV